MIKRIWIICSVFMLLAALASADYLYYGTVQPQNPGESLGGVALKADGDLYYVTFNGASSHFIYVQNAIPGCLSATYTIDIISTETLPAGRGLNDIDLDASGNIYISGTGSDAVSTVLRKFSAAPTHAELWSKNDVRHNGIELMSADVLAIGQTWNQIAWKNTSDGSDTSTAVSGGTNYHRAIALNTLNNDLYVGKNGANSDTALKVFSGGSPTNLTGYSLALDDLLSPLGCNTLYGVACQPVDFDPNNNQLIIGDIFDQGYSLPPDPNVGVRIYDISGSGASTVFTEDQFIDRRLSGDPSPLYGNVYGVSYARVTSLAPARDFIAVAGGVGGISFWIDLFQIPPAGVEDWTLY